MHKYDMKTIVWTESVLSVFATKTPFPKFSRLVWKKDGNSLLFSILENWKGFLEVHSHVNIDIFVYAHAII